MSLLTLLLVILVICFLWGSFGYGRVAPTAPWVGGWSPLGLVIVILIVLYLTGNLRGGLHL